MRYGWRFTRARRLSNDPGGLATSRPWQELLESPERMADRGSIELARKWSDSSRRPDSGVGEQPHQMFARAKAALDAWTKLTIHLQDVN